MKPGTRIEVRGFTIDNRECWYPAKAGMVRAAMLPLPEGYIPVTFDDGGKVLVHLDEIRSLTKAAERLNPQPRSGGTDGTHEPIAEHEQ